MERNQGFQSARVMLARIRMKIVEPIAADVDYLVDEAFTLLGRP